MAEDSVPDRRSRTNGNGCVNKSWSDDYVDFLASFTDAPPLYSKFMAWSLLGAALAGQVAPISLAAEDLRPNFWTILIGPSGEARKSTELKIARRMARRIDKGIAAPQGGSYVGVLEHMQSNPNILFTFDEFKRFMEWLGNDYNREAKSFFTEIYDWPYDEDWVAKRAAGRGNYASQNNSIIIKGPCVSMILGSTEEWLTGAVGRSDMVSGFLVRFLLIPYPGKDTVFPYPPERDKNWENRLMTTLQAARKAKFRYHVTSESREAYQDWYNTVKDNRVFKESAVLRPYFHRMTIYAWKICMVEAIARVLAEPGGLSDTWGLEGQTFDKELKIDAELMGVATDALTGTLEPLIEIFEDSMAKGKFQEQRRDVVEALKAVQDQHKCLVRSTLMRQVKLPKRDLDQVIDALVEERKLVIATQITGKRGKPPVWYRFVRMGEDFDDIQERMEKFWGKKK